MNDDEIAIVVDCAKSVFHGLRASKSAVCEYYASVFDMCDVERVEKLVAERRMNRNDDFAYPFRIEKGLYCFYENAGTFAGSEKFVFDSVTLARSACRDDNVDFHKTPCKLRFAKNRKIIRFNLLFLQLNHLLWQNAVHRFRTLLCLTLVGGQHFKRHRVVAESDGHDVADFHFFCGFDDFAVDFYASAVARFLRHGAPFDNS